MYKSNENPSHCTLEPPCCQDDWQTLTLPEPPRVPRVRRVPRTPRAPRAPRVKQERISRTAEMSRWKIFKYWCNKALFLKKVPLYVDAAILRGVELERFCKRQSKLMVDGTSPKMIRLMVAEIAMVSMDLELQELLLMGTLTEQSASFIADKYGKRAIAALVGPYNEIKPVVRTPFFLKVVHNFGKDIYVENVGMPKNNDYLKRFCKWKNNKRSFEFYNIQKNPSQA